MRRALVTAALTTALLAPAVPALAHPEVELTPAAADDLSFEATDNVDYLGRFPEHSGTAGGAKHPGGAPLFYLTDPRGVYVYDTSKPEAPVRLGSLRLFQTGVGAALAQEDPSTNGQILLVDAAATPAGPAALQVVDVSDPTRLRVLGSVPVTDHTWTCVTAGTNTCAYAYGRTGHIIDLTDPAAPKRLPTTWRSAVGYGTTTNSPYTHDLTEIRPGLVMSAGSSNVLMDTRDPARPVLLNLMKREPAFSSLGYHSVEWARGGADHYLVAGTEIAPGAVPGAPRNIGGSDCKDEESVIEVFDARKVKSAMERYFAGEVGPEAVRATTFTRLDAYDAGGRGLFLQGKSPGNVLYCAHWMEQHPRFKNGGRLTVSYYDRGTRFVDVDPKTGVMREHGWVVAADSYSGSSQWISDDVVYVMDYRRGLEVVKVLDRPATGVRSSGDVIALGSVTLAAAHAPAPPATLPVALAGLLLLVNLVLLRGRSRRTA